MSIGMQDSDMKPLAFPMICAIFIMKYYVFKEIIL